MALNLKPALQALQVDGADGTRASAALEKWVARLGKALPAETALQISFFVVLIGLHNGLLNFFEFLKNFVIRFFEYRVSGVAPLNLSLWLLINFHFGGVLCVSDLFDRELNSSNFEDVFFLNFIILLKMR